MAKKTKMPIKWMSIESLNGVFSEKSDVVSEQLSLLWQKQQCRNILLNELMNLWLICFKKLIFVFKFIEYLQLNLLCKNFMHMLKINGHLFNILSIFAFYG